MLFMTIGFVFVGGLIGGITGYCLGKWDREEKLALAREALEEMLDGRGE